MIHFRIIQQLSEDFTRLIILFFLTYLDGSFQGIDHFVFNFQIIFQHFRHRGSNSHLVMTGKIRFSLKKQQPFNQFIRMPGFILHFVVDALVKLA